MNRISIVLISLLFPISLSAQSVLFSEDFTFNLGNLPPGWSTVSLNDNGPSPAPGQALWSSTPDGTANDGAYWDNRPAILSPSGNSGAVVFNSDFLDSNGQAGQICGGTSCSPHSSALISPTYNLSGQNQVGLRFFQYLHTESAQTLIGISTDGGQNWTNIPVNREITDPPFGGESAEFAPIFVNISQWAANQPQVQIRFLFEGSYFFWIVDDMEIVSLTGEDLALEAIDWPGQPYSCLLSDEEFLRIRIHNNGVNPQSNFPVFYRLDGGPMIQEVFPGTINPNESVDYTFSMPLDLTPDAFNGHVVQAGLMFSGDQVPANDQFFLELAACEIRQDSLGADFIDKHLIVNFNPATPPNIRDSIRTLFAANVLESCSCDSLELWGLSLPVTVDGLQLTTTEGVRNRVKDEAEVEESEFDYLLQRTDPGSIIGPGKWEKGESSGGDSIVVAIIDTGLDFGHDSLSGGFWENETELLNPFAPDDDQNCYDYDNWGYHYLEPGTLPADDHSHGTHIGGIVLKNLPDSVSARLMSLKVQAENGTGTLFHATCAVYYAAEKGARIINMSLGFRGQRPVVMDSALARVGRDHGVFVVTSAGNEAALLDTLPHWPSGFSEDYAHVISVTAVDVQDQIAPFANFGQGVDIAAPGIAIQSTIPGGFLDHRSGTSMAAGIVSRAAVLYLNCNPAADGADVKNFLLSNADIIAGLNSYVAGGKRLASSDSVFLNCSSTPIENDFQNGSINLYPNPVRDRMQVDWEFTKVLPLTWSIISLQGKMIAGGRIVNAGHRGTVELPTASLTPGVYICQIQYGNELVRRLFIKGD